MMKTETMIRQEQKSSTRRLPARALVMALAALLAFMALLSSAPRAFAQTAPPSDVNVPGETLAVRDLLQQSMRAYRLGEFEQAYKFSRSAYLDRFESVEIPLRVLDPDLTLDMEYRFANLRSKMQAGAPANEVEPLMRSVRSGLDEIDSLFTNNGALVPALAFGASFTIIFREGLEAVLVIAALLGALRAGGTPATRRYVLIGIALAIVATVATWLVVRLIISITPVGRELFEAVISIVAVGVLFWVSFWLVNRLDRQRWMEFLHARAWAAMAGGSALGLVGIGFTAVYREGFETALFYEVLLSLARSAELFVLLGFLFGSGVLAIVAYAILKAGVKLPVRTFMSIAVIVVMFISVTFIGKAIYELQNTGLLGVTSLIGVVPRLPRVLADFTGFHPTVETLTAQLALTLTYVTGWFIYRLRQTPINRRPVVAPSEG